MEPCAAFRYSSSLVVAAVTRQLALQDQLAIIMTLIKLIAASMLGAASLSSGAMARDLSQFDGIWNPAWGPKPDGFDQHFEVHDPSSGDDDSTPQYPRQQLLGSISCTVSICVARGVCLFLPPCWRDAAVLRTPTEAAPEAR